jgi:hypothetical protein
VLPLHVDAICCCCCCWAQMSAVTACTSTVQLLAESGKLTNYCCWLFAVGCIINVLTCHCCSPEGAPLLAIALQLCCQCQDRRGELLVFMLAGSTAILMSASKCPQFAHHACAATATACSHLAANSPCHVSRESLSSILITNSSSP